MGIIKCNIFCGFKKVENKDVYVAKEFVRKLKSKYYSMDNTNGSWICIIIRSSYF